MTHPTTCTRNDLAMILGVSVWVIRRHEVRLGLDKCKVVMNQRLILYNRQKALTRLKEVGLLP